MIWCGLKIKENYHVLVNQFHGNFRSKSLSCRKIKYVFRDVKWCFNASWGLKGLIFINWYQLIKPLLLGRKGVFEHKICQCLVSNLHKYNKFSLEVAGRGSETQLQMDANLNNLVGEGLGYFEEIFALTWPSSHCTRWQPKCSWSAIHSELDRFNSLWN